MIIDIPKEVQAGYEEIQPFSFFRNFWLQASYACKNLARYFLLLRHVFTYTPALFSPKRKTCRNEFDFLLLSDPDRWLSVSYFIESFEVFIQLETTINCLKPGLKQGDTRSSYCSYQNQFMFYYWYSCLSKQYQSNHIFMQ